MEITLPIMFLLLAGSHVLFNAEAKATAEPETISPTKYGLLHYAKLKLQSLLTKLTEYTEEVQSLLNSVLGGLGERVNANELRLVAAVWRHGSRGPFKNVFRFPEEQLASQWPKGLREMTQKGIHEQRWLGQFLAERYKEFMTNYTRETIYIRSSDSTRTLKSALATLTSLVQCLPVGEAGMPCALQLPIHRTQLQHDRTLEVNYVNCPPPYRPFIASLSKPSNDSLTAEVDPKLLGKLERALGKKLQTMDLYFFADALISYHDNGKASVLPSWARSPELYRTVKELYNMNMFKQQMDPQYRLLRGSNLFKEIADKFVNKSVEKAANKLEFIGYSAHDTTLLALLTDWGALTPDLIPDFSACVMVELYERASVYYIEIWYVQGYGKKPVELKVKGCREPCRLQEFAAIAQKYASANMTAYCEKFKALGLQFEDQKLT